ncbi:MAG: hypothetical protein ABIB43_05100 [archaeon]
MFQKKGQFTIFIILGLVLLIIVGFVLFVLRDTGDLDLNEIKSLDTSLDSVNSYVKSCLESTAIGGLSYVGRHGGYYNLDNVPSTGTLPYNTAYYFNLGNNVMPSMATVENELASYIDDNLFFCLENFAFFRSQGLDVSIGEIKSIVSLQDNVIVNLEMPLDVERNGVKNSLDSFVVTVDTRLKALFDSAVVLTAVQVNDPENICMSCIFSEASKNGFVIELSNMGDDTVVISMMDEVSEEYLIYANRYVTI